MDDGFLTSQDGLFLYHQRLNAYKWLRHGFSLRRNRPDGHEMSLGFKGYQPREVVIENRRKLIEAIWGRNLPLAVPKQVHSNTVVVLPNISKPWDPPEADGLVTNQAEVVISVQTADCLPVLLADPVYRAVAAVHAGWRGVLKQVVGNAVRLMKASFNSSPADLIAVAGPSIRSCCYEVGEDVIAAFAQEFGGAASLFREPQIGESTRPGTRFLDLQRACEQQLLETGLLQPNIVTKAPCTACDHRRFFSHRAEAGQTGRLLAAIGMVSADRDGGE
jgi:hypothetical protein